MNCIIRRSFPILGVHVTPGLVIINMIGVLIILDLLGDGPRTTQMLGITTALSNLLSIVFNQIGGVMSDKVGRKVGLLVGPLGNIIIGALVYSKPSQAHCSCDMLVPILTASHARQCCWCAACCA